MNPEFTYINNGSYGVVPREVMAFKHRVEEKMNQTPDQWFRVEAEAEITRIRKLTAQRVHCKLENLFLVQNITDAFNCLTKSLEWSQGDTVLLPNTAFKANRNTILFLQEKFKFSILEVANP